MQVKAYKKEFDYSYTLGVFPTLELLQHKPDEALCVFLSTKGSENSGIEKIKEWCDSYHISYQEDDTRIAKLSKSENVYAVGVFKKYSERLERDTNHIVLVSPSDMGNLGTIIRTMLGFGFHDLVIIKPAVDIFDPKVVRASMGALFQIRFAYFDSFDAYAKEFQRNFYPLMTDGKQTLSQTTFTPPFSLLFGNEGAGLPQEFHQTGTSVRIEQTKDIDSLNLSLSVGIALYEARLQTRT